MTVRLPAEAGAFLEEVEAALDGVAHAVEAGFGGLSPAALLWRPAPDRWSVAHCLAHLARTNTLYREALSAAFDGEETGHGAGGPAPQDPGRQLRGSWFGRIFAGMVGPEPAFKVTTPRIFRPPPETVESGALEAFLEEQRAWRALAGRARALSLDRVRVTSPASRWVRLRASDVFAVVVNHELRHLDQARAVVAAPGFPGAA